MPRNICGHRTLRLFMPSLLTGILSVLIAGEHAADAAGTLADGDGVVTWGGKSAGQYANSPTGQFAALAAGASHNVGLRTDGTVVTWGRSFDGQYNNSPSGTFTALAAGAAHSVGLRSDGTVTTWGDSGLDQYVFSPFGTFTALAAGYSHSVGLRSDGTVVTWGNSSSGQYNNSPTGTFAALAAGDAHSVGLRADGTVVTWGDNSLFQYANSPSGTFTALAAGSYHSVGLRSDGTVVTWGRSDEGQYLNSPTGTFTALGAGFVHSIGLRTDGTVVTWGGNSVGQYNNSPSGAFTALAAGDAHSVGLRADGTVVTWGDNSGGQYNNSPTGAFVAVNAGAYHSVGLRARTSYDQGLRIYGSGVTANLNRNVTVSGDVSLESTAKLYNNAAATAYGRLLVQNGALSGAGTMSVYGIDIQTGLSLAQGSRLASSGPLTGSGRLEIGDGSNFPSQVDVALFGPAAYTGMVDVRQRSSLTITGAGLQTAGALFNGADYTPQFGPRVVSPGGTVRVGAGSRLRFTDPAPTNYAGNPLTTPGHYNGGVINVEGLATAPAELEFVGPAVNAASTGLVNGQDARLRFGGGLTNVGALALTSGLNNISGDVNNIAGGKITVSGGASAVFYDDVVQNGTLRVAKVGTTNSTAVFLGAFTGSGGSSGGGDIFFEGDLRPGNSPGSVTFANNVSLGDGAVTHIELAGLIEGTQYDKMTVTGGLALDGELVVSLLGGFMPVAGSSFDILDWGSRVGEFDSLALPALASNLAWNSSRLYTTGALTVGYAGDFDFDGDVDGADFLVWQRGGSPIPNSPADLAAWKQTFGLVAATPAAAAVPEPGTACQCVASLGVAVIAARRRRRDGRY